MVHSNNSDDTLQEQKNVQKTQDHNDKHSENDWNLTEPQKTRALLKPLLVFTSAFFTRKTRSCSPKK